MRIKRLAVCILLLLCDRVYATEHWTAEVSRVTVLENQSALIIVSNPRSGPSSTFPCTQGVVHLGVKNTPVSKKYLSQAMLVYTAHKTIRFGIRGAGDLCELEYITAE